ncbi:TPA: hypothetical protein ACGR4L_001049 [Serratia marcescens]|uniref:hypothetical protein n=1 Tax=Serratia marcescens TaxID=615 RepID=UPI0011C148A5|nr:hypothetical protein [Serratia marcescens]MBH2767766.1 hypothetical protein [Serratia marcescens]
MKSFYRLSTLALLLLGCAAVAQAEPNSKAVSGKEVIVSPNADIDVNYRLPPPCHNHDGVLVCH